MSDELSPILKRYEQLSQFVGLDLMDLERCFQVTPNALQEAGELVAAADQEQNLIHDMVKVAEATAADRHRQVSINGKEPSQARIDSLVPLDPDVQAAKRAYVSAIYEADLCRHLFRSLEVQSRLLTKAAEMVISGYMTPTALHDQRRSEVRRARVEAEQKDARWARHSRRADPDETDE